MYDPPLPGIRDQLTQRMPQASAHKMFVLYEEPFWRAEGLNAQLISEVGPARMSNDSCMPDETGSPGIILAFLEGESARVAGRWPAAQRAEALRAELGRHFGPRAAKPSLIVEAVGPTASGPAVLQRQHRTVWPDPLRGGAQQADRSDQVGRDRDGECLERLHGGRRRGRSPRRPRGPGRSLSYAHVIAPIRNDLAA